MIKDLSEFNSHKLKNPMKVTIIEKGGHFYSYNNYFGIYEDGNTADEAFDNFKLYLGDVYEWAIKLVEVVE